MRLLTRSSVAGLPPADVWRRYRLGKFRITHPPIKVSWSVFPRLLHLRDGISTLVFLGFLFYTTARS